MAEELKYSRSCGPADSKGDEPWEQVGDVDPKAHEYYGNDDREGSDRGLFGFQRRKDDEEDGEDKTYGEAEVCEVTPEKKKLIKIDSSSSSEEEVVEGGEIIKNRKKKKSLHEKFAEKFSGETKEEEEKRKSHNHLPESTAVPVPLLKKFDHDTATAYDHHVEEPEEKKGLMNKIKGKLPCGQMPQAEEEEGPVVIAAAPECHQAAPKVDKEEKKGLLNKIKDKLPGHQPQGGSC